MDWIFLLAYALLVCLLLAWVLVKKDNREFELYIQERDFQKYLKEREEDLNI